MQFIYTSECLKGSETPQGGNVGASGQYVAFKKEVLCKDRKMEKAGIKQGGFDV
jgi:hypothetical protein